MQLRIHIETVFGGKTDDLTGIINRGSNRKHDRLLV
jgi:hypothetical protein